MIDIDADVDAEWLRPKDGYVISEEEEEDGVKFGCTCVDRLVSCVGNEIMLPILGTLVTNTISND
jgi:hypothetical protein